MSCICSASAVHVDFQIGADLCPLMVILCVRIVVSLFICSFCAHRRDSAVIKEEIKSFLATRRISQAVVAQVTGEYQLHLPLLKAH